MESEPVSIGVNDLSRQRGKAVGDTVKDEARLWVKQAIALTPPTSNGEVSESGEKVKPKAVGERAVFRDIMRSGVPVDPYWDDAPKFIKNTHIRELLTDKSRGKRKKALNKAAFEAILKNLGKRGSKYANWRVVDQWTPEMHHRAQNRRGHVVSSQKIFVFGPTAVRKFWTYMRKMKRHVMRLKAAWAPGYFALGGKSVPSGVRRHLNSGVRGGVTVNLNDPHFPSVEVTNSAAGATSPHMINIVRSTFTARAEAMKRRCYLLANDFSKAAVGKVKDIRASHSAID